MDAAARALPLKEAINEHADVGGVDKDLLKEARTLRDNIERAKTAVDRSSRSGTRRRRRSSQRSGRWRRGCSSLGIAYALRV